MNAPSPITAPAPSDDGGTEAGTIEQRHTALLDELRSDPSQPAGEVEDDAQPPAGAAPVASPADSADETRRKERRARLAAFAESERKSVDHKERQAAQDKLQRDYAAAQARAEQAEARARASFDRSVLKDPIAVMRMMEAEGVHADKVAEAIRESLSNPDVGAARAAREAVSPELQAMRERTAALEGQIQSLLQQQAQHQRSATERQQTEAFVGYVAQAKDRAPLAAALLAHDREEFLQIADLAGNRIAEGSGIEALLDAVEDVLDSDIRQVAQKYAAIYGPQPATSPATQTRPGAVQPKTVSNSLAQERGSVVEEEDYAKLPVEERARRLIRSM